MRKIEKKYIIGFVLISLMVGLLLFLHSILSKQIDGKEEAIQVQNGFEEGERIKSPSCLKFSVFEEDINSEYAFSGNQSLYIPSSQQFQNIAKLNSKYKSDYFVELTCTYNSESTPLFVAQVDKELYEVSKVIKEHANGWKTIQNAFFIPPNLSKKEINFYIWNKEKKDVWIDSLSIQISPKRTYPTSDSLDFIHLMINNEPLYQLKSYREKAYETGTITPESKQSITALINTDGRLKNVELRLKGDWLDHLKGDKWSYRIEITEDSWKGMREFSIQAPATRDYINEWFLHQIALDEGLLATRYGFINLYLNGESKGFYAYEEHFKKQIVESGKHREGPILKFDEFEFWDNIRAGIPSDQAFETTEIHAFGEKKIKKNTNLLSSFTLGQNLVQHFRWQTADASEIFDIEKTARTFALLDCFYAHHAFRWHNQRFYYNPVLSRLQPIIFDCYVDKETFSPQHDLLGMSRVAKNNPMQSRYMNLLNDSTFREAYFNALNTYSSPEFFNSYRDKYAEEISKLENTLQKEFPFYHFNTDKMTLRAEQVRDSLSTLISWFSGDSIPNQYAQISGTNPGPTVYKSPKVNLSHCINAYTLNYDTVYIQILSEEKIDFVGFGSNNRLRTEIENQPKINRGEIYFTAQIPFPDFEYKYIYFKDDTGNTYKVKINELPTPGTYNPRTELYEKYQISETLKHGNSYIITAGEHYFDQPIVVPIKSKLIIRANAKLHFSDGAGLISFSPVYLEGTKNAPIEVSSSDTVSGYFIVLDANDYSNKASKVEHTIFRNQNTLAYNGWNLTGSVCFYESDVNIQHCTFDNNHSEDALNIIRSHFKVQHSIFSNTFSDAFDSDFCTGKLSQSEFIYTGNDAIDFSGSQINIDGCHMNNIGDKGISSGEQSSLIVNNCTINTAVTGMSAKDLSSIKGTNNFIQNVDIGFLLLEKKLEFGPGTIKLTESKVEDALKLHVIEMGSILQLNNKTYKGNSQNLKMQFY